MALSGRPIADEAERLALVNVITQLGHLTAHRGVARRLAEGTLQLHGMYFHVAEAQAYMLDPATGIFTAVAPDAAAPDAATPPPATDAAAEPVPPEPGQPGQPGTPAPDPGPPADSGAAVGARPTADPAPNPASGPAPAPGPAPDPASAPGPETESIITKV